jgi:uncharacterized protein
MDKTKFESFCNKHVCRGCKFCVRGEKLVLFVGGKCSRNCWYCSLSKNRKNSPIVYANERPVEKIGDIIREARVSNSKGAGVTGGDPFLYFDETLSYVKALKKKFGESFHIHMYLPLNLVDKKKLLKMSRYVDEVRFHPSFLIDKSKSLRKSEIQKIKLASEIYGRRNCGIELPCLEDAPLGAPHLAPRGGKREEILSFIGDVKNYIGFCNLNEFELSETNFDVVTKKYRLNEDTYTVSGSVEAGQWIIKEVDSKGWDVPVHLCTAKTKDCFQFINRLLKHEILPYGKRTEEGTVVYFAAYYGEGDKSGTGEGSNGTREEVLNKIKSATKSYFDDEEKMRVIIDMKYVEKVYKKTKLKIARVEEHPTYGAEYLEFGYIDE